MVGSEIHAPGGEGQTVTADRNTLIGDINGVLIMYTVYYSPSDSPGEWVVRKFTIEDLEEKTSPQLWGTSDTLQGVRKLMPPGMIAVPRHDQDDPTIWETWI